MDTVLLVLVAVAVVLLAVVVGNSYGPRVGLLVLLARLMPLVQVVLTILVLPAVLFLAIVEVLGRLALSVGRAAQPFTDRIGLGLWWLNRRPDSLSATEDWLLDNAYSRTAHSLVREMTLESVSRPSLARGRKPRILARDGNQCVFCGKRARHVDWVVPYVRGGTSDDSNLVACCGPCRWVKQWVPGRSLDAVVRRDWPPLRELDSGVSTPDSVSSGN